MGLIRKTMSVVTTVRSDHTCCGCCSSAAGVESDLTTATCAACRLVSRYDSAGGSTLLGWGGVDGTHRAIVTNLPPNIPPPPPPRGTTPGWLLPAPTAQRDWWKHPLFLVPAGLFLVGLVGAYWYVVIPAGFVVAVCVVLFGRRQYRLRECERLRRAADESVRN